MNFKSISLVNGIAIKDKTSTKSLASDSFDLTPSDENETAIKGQIESQFGKTTNDIAVHITKGAASKEDNGLFPAGILFVRTGLSNGAWPDTEVDE